ncbi:MAG: SDR family NAD(P)-dependent oxidoreductase [Candidatus Binatus sp.]|uniref:SDR family NAD(P)-dependent oxidoreductase n=1 Tax=Candidatus Binatus sp. TaxID=2811406 RepID=UPI00272329D0|nr:SDR family NAD(P)-dependent oxidoreductase [Candidatus Binatus sp.]MDO8432640.1 SDR family NAD(P)-dependent oxidoreductase [Candidatus Binatus sp.]
MNELADKVAIITGGGYGIGKQIALLYGDAGAKIVIAARSLEPMKQACAELERNGAKAIYVATDVSKEADCAKMAAETLSAFGRIDILVNNAGISGPTKRITEMSLAEWQETIDIDLTGAWLATRAVLPTMDKQRSGNILNISSGAGRRGYPMRSPYAAAKWAMIGLTQTVAGEWGQRGIRCNCICPGAIEGDRIERVMRARAEALKQPYEQIRAGFLSTAAMNRMATEEEVARVALAVVSDAYRGVTGQTINVDCGSIMN